MEVILDDDTGHVYVKREETPPGVEAQRTHQYRKFGVTMVWDGHGELLGVEFAGKRGDISAIRTVSSTMSQPEGVELRA